MVTLIEDPPLLAPIADWEAYLERLHQEDPDDHLVRASIASAERIIAQKRELESDNA